MILPSTQKLNKFKKVFIIRNLFSSFSFQQSISLQVFFFIMHGYSLKILEIGSIKSFINGFSEHFLVKIKNVSSSKLLVLFYQLP